MTPMSNIKPLPAGTLTESMICGKRLPIKILSAKPPADPMSFMGNEYECAYVGTEKVCLDFGQNWYASPGDKFTVHQRNIESAAEWKAKGY